MTYGHQAQVETWVHIPWGPAYWASETHMQSKRAEQSTSGLGCSGGAPSVVTRMVRACCVAAVRPCGLRRVMTVAQLAAPPPPCSACTSAHSSPLVTTKTPVHLCGCASMRPSCSIGRQWPIFWIRQAEACEFAVQLTHRAGHGCRQHRPAHERRGQREVARQHGLIQLDRRPCSKQGVGRTPHLCQTVQQHRGGQQHALRYADARSGAVLLQ